MRQSTLPTLTLALCLAVGCWEGWSFARGDSDDDEPGETPPGSTNAKSAQNTGDHPLLPGVPAGGPWLPHFVGSGEIEDLLTGGKITLPPERRIHIAILPEGFTQAGLDAGALEVETDRWLDEILKIEPYASFREALVVWKRPLVSAAPVAFAAPQTADTALRVPISRDGFGVAGVPTQGATSARIWRALGDFPIPLSYYGPGGRTDRMARNLIVVVPVMDPTRGVPGFSGRTVTLANPRNGRQRVAVALALGRAHEFGHAFARLVDEYLEDDYAGRALDSGNPRAWVSNVVARADCDTLPWRHLLHGSPLNPDHRDLVGAFGTPTHGFHPELKCLMNGTHDNARYYGGSGHLRSGDRLCNFCREVTTFRFLERTGVLPEATRALPVWESQYRPAFYRRFGFQAPTALPQTNDLGQAHYQACTPPTTARR